MSRGRKFYFTEEQDALIVDAFKLKSDPPVKVNVAEISRQLAKLIPTSAKTINNRYKALKTESNLANGWEVKRFGRLPPDKEILRVYKNQCRVIGCIEFAEAKYCMKHIEIHINNSRINGHNSSILRYG